MLEMLTGGVSCVGTDGVNLTPVDSAISFSKYLTISPIDELDTGLP